MVFVLGNGSMILNSTGLIRSGLTIPLLHPCGIQPCRSIRSQFKNTVITNKEKVFIGLPFVIHLILFWRYRLKPDLKSLWKIPSCIYKWHKWTGMFKTYRKKHKFIKSKPHFTICRNNFVFFVQTSIFFITYACACSFGMTNSICWIFIAWSWAEAKQK